MVILLALNHHFFELEEQKCFYYSVPQNFTWSLRYHIIERLLKARVILMDLRVLLFVDFSRLFFMLSRMDQQLFIFQGFRYEFYELQYLHIVFKGLNDIIPMFRSLLQNIEGLG